MQYISRLGETYASSESRMETDIEADDSPGDSEDYVPSD